MRDGFAPLEIEIVGGITIAAVLGTALVDNGALAAVVGLVFASWIGVVLFTFADSLGGTTIAAMPKADPQPRQ